MSFLTQKLIWRKIKLLCTYRMQNTMASRYTTTRVTKKKMPPISDDFGGKEPRHEERLPDEKHYLYRSPREHHHPT